MFIWSIDTLDWQTKNADTTYNTVMNEVHDGSIAVDLKGRLGLSLMFITHDLGVVQHVTERLIVMYHGVVAEEGDCRKILSSPQSDYTRNLIAAVPRIAVQNV